MGYEISAPAGIRWWASQKGLIWNKEQNEKDMGGGIEVCTCVLNKGWSNWPMLPPAVTIKEGRLFSCLPSTSPTTSPGISTWGEGVWSWPSTSPTSSHGGDYSSRYLHMHQCKQKEPETLVTSWLYSLKLNKRDLNYNGLWRHNSQTISSDNT